MKLRKRELAKPGIYGTVDNPTVVTERELEEIAETFPEIKKSPVSLSGHWLDPSKPRLGNVVSLAYDKASKVLSGEVEEHDTLAAAVDAGYYPDVSISGKRRAADGKMYLHHLAYLGEEPPAIKDLVAEIKDALAEPEGDEIAAADSASCVSFPSPTAKQLFLSDPEATGGEPVAKPGAPAGKQPRKEDSMDPLDEAVAGITDEAKKKEAGGALAGLKAQADQAAKYKAQLEKLAKDYPDAGIELSDRADPRVDELVRQVRAGKTEALLRSAAGKIPKAKQGLLSALAGTFSLGSSVELSDGEKKVEKSQFEALAELVDSLPPLVRPGKLDLSDGEDEKLVDLAKLKGKI